MKDQRHIHMQSHPLQFNKSLNVTSIMLELPIIVFESGHYKEAQVGGELLCICECVIAIIPSNFLIMLIEALLEFSMFPEIRAVFICPRGYDLVNRVVNKM